MTTFMNRRFFLTCMAALLIVSLIPMTQALSPATSSLLTTAHSALSYQAADSQAVSTTHVALNFPQLDNRTNRQLQAAMPAALAVLGSHLRAGCKDNPQTEIWLFNFLMDTFYLNKGIIDPRSSFGLQQQLYEQGLIKDNCFIGPTSVEAIREWLMRVAANTTDILPVDLSSSAVREIIEAIAKNLITSLNA